MHVFIIWNSAMKASYLKTLSEQADDPDAFDTSLTKAEASKRIDALKARTSRTRK
jgi:Protein of unknown function (DUF3072)